MTRGELAGFREAAAVVPLVAILRGLAPARAAGVARALVEAGFRMIEIPLNREGALDAIRVVSRTVPHSVVVGAGTVLTRAQVRDARDAGAQMLVMPHVDGEVMAEGRELGLAVMPGVMTPTEALAAQASGVDALKLFPAEIVGPAGLNALRSVLPSPRAPIYAVGGVTPENMRVWHDAGADGFGIGSALFQSAFSDDDIASRARGFVAAWRLAKGT